MQDRQLEYQQLFSTALHEVEANYVDDVPSDRLIYSSVQGMLQTLDPHSNFLDPRAYAQLRERQEGKYYGLGIQIQVIDGDITVSSIFEGSPAYKLGMRQGDVIARIEGEDTKGWTSDQAVKKLRGPKGSPVHISLKRTGFEKLIDLTVVRDEINIPTIPAAYMVRPGVGYIKQQDFSETTDRDLERALRMLQKKGMQRLILDLRGNPGGPLDQAIKVSNEFLPKGKLIVFTRGRVAGSDQDYVATEDSEFTDFPLVVLVSRTSASASEIVAGALQDHDRALIVGETTFGKALVQSIYRISQGAGLALTTARYYTPSGRLIQRPYTGSFDEYFAYAGRDQDDQPEGAPKRGELKLTDSGRKVFGGGGIDPDHHIEPLHPKSKLGRLVSARRLFGPYAQRYSEEGDTRITGTTHGRRFVKRGFAVDAAMLDDFKSFLQEQKVRVDDKEVAEDADYMKALIKWEIDLALWGFQEAQENLAERDPQIQAALQMFPEAEKLSMLSRKPTPPVGKKAEPLLR